MRRQTIRHASLLLLALSAMGVAAFSTPAVPLALIRVWAPLAPFELADSPRAGAIVLLGAGTDRVVEAARVYRLLDRPWLISSGGPRQDRPRLSSAVVMRDSLIALGVPADRILLERASSTTHEQAVLVAPMLRALGSERFVLVTSRSHMPRAEAVFRAQGLDPVPAPSEDLLASDTEVRSWRPSRPGVRLSRALIHEVVGFAYYWAQGWLTPERP